ncbi:MAG: TonB-dependent receptor plug domain-containing protein, partial [Bacteroidales bacterium]|nr:TonB-dependent receptor plug domain-containing protein [Bacteroidales bacterium]
MKKILTLVLTALCCTAVLAQTRVTGTVTAADDGTPVSFATIAVKGSTNLITTTDMDGRFTFANIPGNAVLIISYIGYTTQEIAVNNRTIVNILLAPDATALDEVMVVAYGTVRRESYSGAASVMRAERLQDVPVIGFEQALQGNLTGVQMSNTSGLPGAFPEIRIRGVGSMQAGNDPLYVIDGVVAISGDWSVSNTWTSAMNFLNPGDIESITVLKDAAAAALYGSRASNGVVLITTKRGRAGKTKVSFKNNIGFSNFAFNNHPLASEEDTEMLHREAWRNYGVDNPSVWASFGSLEAYVEDRVEFYYPSRKPGYGYVDWEKALFRTAISRKHELSISGGNEGTRIFLSGAYTADESVSKTR